MATKQQTLTYLNNEIKAVQERRAVDKARLKRLRERREEVSQRPELPEPTCAVITFEKQYERYGKTYRYAAIKAEGFWYVTGATSPQRLTWERLAEFIEKDNRLSVGYFNRLIGSQVVVTI